MRVSLVLAVLSAIDPRNICPGLLMASLLFRLFFLFLFVLSTAPSACQQTIPSVHHTSQPYPFIHSFFLSHLPAQSLPSPHPVVTARHAQKSLARRRCPPDKVVLPTQFVPVSEKVAN